MQKSSNEPTKSINNFDVPDSCTLDVSKDQELLSINKQPTIRRWKRRSTSAPSESSQPKSLALPNGVDFPLLGLGTWGLHGSDLRTALDSAVHAGYGLIDTSSAYGNEVAIGQILKESTCTKQLLIQSKIGPRDMGRDKARQAALKSIACLGRLDILVIHWPGRNRKQRFETWQVLEELYNDGKVRVIGVSNFLPEHIDALHADGAKIKPMTNQFELHPLCQGRSIVDYCTRNGIIIQSYSTLGGGPAQGKIRLENGTGILLSHPVVVAVAKEAGRSCACVCLRWAIQQKFGVIPKSRSPHHIENNAEVFEFELTEEQMLRLQGVEQNRHFAWDPSSLNTRY